MILKKWKCSIKDYPTEIKVSDKRRAVWYKLGDTIPKKYVISTVDKEGFLIDDKGNRILKNIKTAGKPKMLTINAQKIYVGIHHSVRSKIVNELHGLFNEEFKKQLPAKIELGENKIMIGLHFQDVYTNKLPDLDNLANLFVKCGVDCLTTVNNPNQMTVLSTTHKLGILPDDKMAFIPHIYCEFTDVKDVKDRRLDFHIYLVTPDFNLGQVLEDTLKSV